MRILLVHQVFVTPEEGGGTRHYEMCKYLVRHGHAVTVIASETDYLSGKKRDVAMEEKDGIKIYYAKVSQDVHSSLIHRALNFFSFSYYAYKLGKTLNNFDIIWGTTPPLFQSFTASLLAKKKNALFLLEIRDLWLDFAHQLGIIKNPFIFYIFKKIELFIYNRADKFIVNSPGFVPHVNKGGNNKIEVFPNVVDIT